MSTHACIHIHKHTHIYSVSLASCSAILFCFSERGSYSVVLIGLKFTVELRQFSNSWQTSCLSLSDDGLTGCSTFLALYIITTPKGTLVRIWSMNTAFILEYQKTVEIAEAVTAQYVTPLVKHFYLFKLFSRQSFSM